VWVHCEARDCHHRSPLKLAEPIARYGEDMTSDVLRLKTRCSNCGTRGATLRLPSWVDSTTGHAPFPDWSSKARLVSSPASSAETGLFDRAVFTAASKASQPAEFLRSFSEDTSAEENEQAA
jgi:hypothetical protein